MRSGNKAAGLARLIGLGAAVPETWAVDWRARERYARGDGEVLVRLRAELDRLGRIDRSWAVRSSANIEDSVTESFAGQFHTVLDVRGTDALVAAVKSVWDAACPARVEEYLKRSGRTCDELRMGVLVQAMVKPVLSGVAFSKNPMTGLAETIVEAVPGRGDALVQGGVTPLRWTWKWGEWTVRPAAGALLEPVAERIVRETRRVARRLRRPVDVEWVWDGGRLWLVQVRDITSLAGVNVYSNAISREMLPGQVKPLVWSVNIPLVNAAWVRFFTELIGPNDIDPLALARAFHYRTYFNMGVIGRIFESLGMPQDSLELMMGVQSEGSEKPRMMPSLKALRHAFRMLGFALDKYRFARRTEKFLPRARGWYDEFRRIDPATLSDTVLLERVDRLFDYTLETAYHNVVTPLLMLLYNRLLRTRLEKLGRDFAELDLTRGLDGFDDVDPKPDIARLHAELDRLDPALRAQARTVAGLAAPGLESYRRAFEDFVERFGHLSDSGVDFSYVPWRERPDDVLGMIADFVPRDGSRLKSLDELGLGSRDLRRLNWLAGRARQFRLLRERVSSLYTYGYGLFRPLFTELGRRWTEHGRLASADDIFHLYLDEVRAVARGERLDARSLAAGRRAEMAACAGARLPGIIFGDTPPPLEDADASRLLGVATSRGYYRGPARVIRNTSDFARLQKGDVLVIPFSDVGWTPLFARAGAVVAESGGILSHSSIIAREYNIPAVVSVIGALGLPDGAEVTVDGFTGEITVHKSPREV
ncbi:MAG: PEP/pyruvate-binding domain-containing protein [bacterium]